MSIRRTITKKGFRYKCMIWDQNLNAFMRSRTHGRRIDAEQEERMLIDAKNKGYGENIFTPLHFDQAAQQWLDDCRRRNRAPSHIVHLEQHVRNHMVPFFQKTDVKRIKPSNIGAYTECLSKKELANVTINGALTILKSLFNFHIEEGNIAMNPVKRNHRLAASNRSNKPVLTNDEVKRFLEYTDAKYQGTRRWQHVFYKIAVSTGARFGEILALDLKDFDFDNSRITISKSFCSVSRKIKLPKNNKTRYAPLPSQLAEEVKTFIAAQEIAGPLFLNSDGKYFTHGAVDQNRISDMKGAGVRITTLHNFRRWFCNAFIEQNGNPIHLRKIVGHASEEMTDHYTTLNEDLATVSALVNV